MNKRLLEVCAYSLEGCKNALLGGANRIELCANPMEGGTTPSYGLIKKVKEYVNLTLYPLIRPRGGDFYYTSEEFEIMLSDIEVCKQLGCDGISTGIQTIDGQIDVERMSRLVEAAYPLGVTCNRVFDVVPDAFKALEDIIKTGCERILTSGLSEKATDAIDLISNLVDLAGNRIVIMPGSGVRAENIEQLVLTTHATEYHTSAMVLMPTKVKYSNEISGFGDTVTCDIDQIRTMRYSLDILVK